MHIAPLDALHLNRDALQSAGATRPATQLERSANPTETAILQRSFQQYNQNSLQKNFITTLLIILLIVPYYLYIVNCIYIHISHFFRIEK